MNSVRIGSLLLVALVAWVVLPGLAWADSDGDGFEPPEDCDDSDAGVHPGAAGTVGPALADLVDLPDQCLDG